LTTLSSNLTAIQNRPKNQNRKKNFKKFQKIPKNSKKKKKYFSKIPQNQTSHVGGDIVVILSTPHCVDLITLHTA
jgi:hypothetical protein